MQETNLCFYYDCVYFYLGDQFGFSLVGFVFEVAEQIQFVRALAAHDFRQHVFLAHLKNQSNKLKNVLRASWIVSIYLKCKAVRNFERVFLGAPFALEDVVSHDAEGVHAAQATQVDEGHRCPGTCFNECYKSTLKTRSFVFCLHVGCVLVFVDNQTNRFFHSQTPKSC
jgi:hypothetical protein